jgi:hypothetical protein
MPRLKQQRQLKKCKICDVHFEYLPSWNKQYCSKKCANADPEVKQKQRDALKLIWDEKGHPMTHKDIQKKHKLTMTLKYGVEHALCSTDILSKSRQTKLKKYGNENFNNLDKVHKTKLKKYGSATYNGPVKRMINKYSDILIKWKHVVPMFTELEYNGVDNMRYTFQCNECTNIFQSSVDNGIIPICRVCTPTQVITQSKGEKEIIEYIRSLVPECIIIEKDRKILSGKELDIVLPEYNIAIEYNGLYWHSESKLTNKKYHLNKSKQCLAAGYSLIHIFDYQWYQNQDIVKSIISTKLKCNTIIPARKCIVKEIKSKVKNDFLNRTHLQGYCNSRVNLGLYYDDNLVAVCTLGRARYTKQYEWELIRFASELNCTIVGGFSKLLSYFIKIYNPKNVFTYCDRAISNGNAYFKNNFKLIGVTSSNYFYFKGANVYSREVFQKHKLQSKISIFNNTLTEYENMLINGYDRYWDCGNYKFLFTP